MPWLVILTGKVTGHPYEVTVEADADAHKPTVYASAAHAYNAARERGEIAELFGPPMSATYKPEKKEN